MNLRSVLIKIYLITGLLLGGCLKNEDNTPTGPKALLSISHFSVGAPAITIQLNGSNPIDTIAYNENTATSTSIYLPIDAGIQQMLLKSGNTVLLNKNILLDASANYSMFLVDSFKNNALHTILIKDDTATIDTLAKVRWLHLKPGNELLSAALVNLKDTAVLAFNTLYFDDLINSQSMQAINFGTLVKPGTYRLELFKGNNFLSGTNGIIIEPRMRYSFIAIDSAKSTIVKLMQNK